MEIRAAEISEVIKQQIADYNREVEVNETGVVLSCGDGIARIYGLDKAAAGELLQFPHDIFGMVLNLEEDNVGAVLFGETRAIGEGDEVRRTGPHRRGPGRSGTTRSRRERARPAHRRQRSDREHRESPHRAQGAWHRRRASP